MQSVGSYQSTSYPGSCHGLTRLSKIKLNTHHTAERDEEIRSMSDGSKHRSDAGPPKAVEGLSLTKV